MIAGWVGEGEVILMADFSDFWFFELLFSKCQVSIDYYIDFALDIL